MNVSQRACLILTLGTSLSAPATAQSPGSVAQNIQNSINSIEAYADGEEAYVGQIEQRLQDAVAVLDSVAHPLATNTALYAETFNLPLVLDLTPQGSGYIAFGNGGSPDASNYISVQNPNGLSVPITALTFHPVDIATAGLTLPPSVDPNLLLLPGFTLAIYAGSFGGGSAHVGYALHADLVTASMVTFAPLTVPSDLQSSFTAEDIAAFMSLAVHGADGDALFEFLTGPVSYASLKADHSASPRRQFERRVPAEWSTTPNPTPPDDCDLEAVKECLDRIVRELENELKMCTDEFDKKMAKILEDTMGAKWKGLWGWVGGGASAGFVGGTFAGGPGGAAVGTLAGGLGGALGWLVDSTIGSGGATDAAAKLQACREEYEAAVCEKKTAAGEAMKACVEEHCPDYSIESICEIIADWLTGAGC